MPTPRRYRKVPAIEPHATPFTLNTTGNTRSRMGSRSATTTVESRPPRLAAVPIGQLENLLGKAHVATLMIETRCVLRRVTREYFLLNDEEPQEDE